jgi:hypothetical protein
MADRGGSLGGYFKVSKGSYVGTGDDYYETDA